MTPLEAALFGALLVSVPWAFACASLASSLWGASVELAKREAVDGYKSEVQELDAAATSKGPFR